MVSLRVLSFFIVCAAIVIVSGVCFVGSSAEAIANDAISDAATREHRFLTRFNDLILESQGKGALEIRVAMMLLLEEWIAAIEKDNGTFDEKEYRERINNVRELEAVEIKLLAKEKQITYINSIERTRKVIVLGAAFALVLVGFSAYNLIASLRRERKHKRLLQSLR